MHVPSDSPISHDHLNCVDAVCHSDELFYVFHSSGFVNGTYTADESQLSFDMLLYWTNFARGIVQPNSNLPTWPTYSTSSNQSISFDIPISILSNYHQQKVCFFLFCFTNFNLLFSQCDFWDSLGYYN